MRILLLISIFLVSPAMSDTLRVTIKDDPECGHIQIVNQSTGEIDSIMLADIKSDEPTESKYVLMAREYLDNLHVNRKNMTKTIFRNLTDGITIDLSKYATSVL